VIIWATCVGGEICTRGTVCASPSVDAAQEAGRTGQCGGYPDGPAPAAACVRHNGTAFLRERTRDPKPSHDLDEATMHNFIPRALLGAAAVVCCAGFPAVAGGPMFWNAEMERGMWPGVYVPYDGAPLTERYSYQTGGFLYFGRGASARQVYLMDYLDRRERAEKFGYRLPPDPFHQAPVQCYPYQQIQPAPQAPVHSDPALAPAVYFYRR
jgi:hypothetical protein